MTTMTMCRAMCLLAIVLYCVGVANANDAEAKRIAGLLKRAHEMAKESSKLREECETATKAAEEAAAETAGFAIMIESNLGSGTVNISDVDKKKKKGNQLIDKATKAADQAKGLAEKCSQKADDIFVVAGTQIETVKQRGESLQKKVDAELLAMKEGNMATIETTTEAASKDLTTVSLNGYAAVRSVETAVNNVNEALKKLEAAVAAAKKKKGELTKAEKEKKQVDSQAQSQTQDPTVAGHQGQAEGNKTQQTTEKGKDAQEQHSRRTITVNIRGENLDALFNDAKNKSGMALQDSSSVPALLRVPLLLLLLFSVLGCITVC